MSGKEKLKDVDLTSVAGGGGGPLPPEGLTYTLHSGIVCGRFYADVNKSNRIIYVIQPIDEGLGLLQYYKLKLSVNGNNWKIIEPNALVTYSDLLSDLNVYYPYLLNVLP